MFIVLGSLGIKKVTGKKIFYPYCVRKLIPLSDSYVGNFCSNYMLVDSMGRDLLIVVDALCELEDF